jgi:uncharacterized protein
MFNIALMYQRGQGLKKSWPRAIAWFRKAASRGHVRSQYWLGRIYGGDEDYPVDLPEALKWLQMAAEAGDADAQCNLGVHYHEGLGVARFQRSGASLQACG